MRRFLLTIPAIWACQSEAAPLVGQTVPPYPSGYSSEMGKCIAEADSVCAYTIATLHDASGDVVGILAEQAIGDASDPRSRILDHMPAPGLEPGQMWAIEECRVGGRDDPAAVGIVAYKDMGGWLETGETVWAVRLDLESMKLEEIAATRVECLLPGS